MIPQLLPIYRNLRYRTLLSDSWTPAELFASSEVGVWYDPSDLSTMFQNSDGTTAVAVGDPVGYIADKSGNGKHATQATADSRPILRQDGTKYYLEFDGTDDFLVTSAIDFTATDAVSVFSGVHKDTDPTTAVVLELTTTTATSGSFGVYAPRNGVTSEYGTISKGTLSSDNTTINAGYHAPHTAVITAIFDISDDTNNLSINGGATTSNITNDQGTGNYSNAAIYIGRRAGTTLPLDGRIYSLIVRGATSSASEIASAETYVNSKTGAY